MEHLQVRFHREVVLDKRKVLIVKRSKVMCTAVWNFFYADVSIPQNARHMEYCWWHELSRSYSEFCRHLYFLSIPRVFKSRIVIDTWNSSKHLRSKLGFINKWTNTNQDYSWGDPTFRCQSGSFLKDDWGQVPAALYSPWHGDHTQGHSPWSKDRRENSQKTVQDWCAVLSMCHDSRNSIFLHWGFKASPSQPDIC